LEGLLQLAPRLAQRGVCLRGFVQHPQVARRPKSIDFFEIEWDEKALRASLAGRMRSASGGGMATLGGLFYHDPARPADVRLARRAQGSLGAMVALGRELLLRHAGAHFQEKYVSPSLLDELESG
jgi:hypothetical protein